MINDILKEINIDNKEGAYIKAPKPPYISYWIIKEHRTYNGVFICVNNTTLELYTLKLDKILEDRIENILMHHDLDFYKSTEWIESEKKYQTVYEFSYYTKGGLESEK